METKNTFLDTYKKKVDEQKTEDTVKVPAAVSEQQNTATPEKSGLVKPKNIGAERPPSVPAKSKKTAAIAVGSVVLICIIVALFLLLNRGISMINLVGWTENDAQLWARSNGIILQVEEEYNDEYEEGRVVSQSIAEGIPVKKGDFVRIVVSLGHDLSVTLPIPDFMSMTKKEIDDWAAENFMTKVRITTEFSDTVEAGKVIRYEINDDRVVNEVRRDSPIYIIISKGPEDKEAATIEIPNFKIMSIAECYSFAEENGLVLTIEEEYDDFAPKGSIISQSVKAEEKVPVGTEIILVVSKGKMIAVPDFSKYPKDMAAAVAGELGIPITISERYSSLPAGSFISQSIKAGTIYESGQMVELSYSIDNRITLPSFVGQTKDAIEMWAKELNSKGASIKIKSTNTSSNTAPGTILTQDKSNTLIAINATINITVSSGKIVYVPDFVAPAGSGYDVAITREEAIAMCEALNIVPIFVAESKAGRLPGEVWSQSISAGKEINEGSTITLKYNPANVQVTVPDFTNMTKEEILANNYHKSFDIKFVVGAEYQEGMDDKVYEQSLQTGTKVAAGTVITLTIGPKQVAAPEF
ncbi:MAG TPA: PASTA domain-containing protein [Clostridiales bacterium]|nr:PASTA domain-containing protein [Clostridiales bacterium]